MRSFFFGLLGPAILLTVPMIVGCGGGGGGGSTSPTPYLVSTLAGGSGFGAKDDIGTHASFHNPVNVALDPQGVLYVADFDNGLVRRVTPQGAVTTVVKQSNFVRPFGITFAPDGTLYVQTDENDLGERDTTTGTIWRVDTQAGGATVVARNMGLPRGLTALPDGRLVLVDLIAGTVRLMDPKTAAITNVAGTADVLGFANATGPAAKFSRPYGPVMLPNGDILLADQNNNCLREVTLGGVVTTYAGTGTAGNANGQRLAATFNTPQDVTIDQSGVIYVDDNGNHTIRRIDPNGMVTTVAGGSPPGFADGPGLKARFFGQEGMTIKPDGSILYVADGTGGDDSQPYSRIRAVSIP